MPTSTVANLASVEGADGEGLLRRRLRLYRITTALLALVVGLAVVDGLDLVDVYGVDAATVRARGPGGVLLEVEYGAVTRPALATPFRVRVVDPGGFDGPVHLAVTRAWIEVWDENGLYPSPSSETADDRWVVWEFDAPDGDTFELFYDARLEPARQTSKDGAVELRDAQGAVLARVEFTTAVRP